MGNKGKKFKRTYHNVGFRIIERLSSHYEHKNVIDNRGQLYQLSDGPSEYLGKPGENVNNSGDVLSEWYQQYNLKHDRLLVVYDDFSLDVGQLRIRPGGRAGGHNGMGDIIDCLGTTEIPRIRVGIGPVSPGGDPAEFVLSKITRDDWKVFQEIFSKFPTLVEDIVNEGMDYAMNQWNGVQFDGRD